MSRKLSFPDNKSSSNFQDFFPEQGFSFSENLLNPCESIPTKTNYLNVFSRKKTNLEGEKKFTQKLNLNRQGK